MRMTRDLGGRVSAVVFASLVALPMTTLAEERATTQGYIFGAVGGASPGGCTLLHFGGGVEVLAYKGLGVGGEIGYLGCAAAMGGGLGVLDINGSYHFPTGATQKVVPFVTGGYTMFFREGHANLFNIGGGVNYWARERFGLRIEFRDHVWPYEYGTEHYFGFRAGLAIR